jgi:hypothetical protein
VDLSLHKVQASASPGRGGVTVSGNKPGSYPAVLVFSASKRGEFDGRRCRIEDGLLRYQPAGESNRDVK